MTEELIRPRGVENLWFAGPNRGARRIASTAARPQEAPQEPTASLEEGLATRFAAENEEHMRLSADRGIAVVAPIVKRWGVVLNC